MAQQITDTQVRNQYGRLPGDENLIVRFMQEAVEDDTATAETGVVSYKDEVFVDIIIPGNNTLKVYDIANDQHKFRFIREWEAYQAGQRVDVSGTPLKQWPQISAGQVRTLASMNVHSVEQLAAVSDAHIARVQMSTLKHKAKAWLEAQAGQASLMKTQAELERRDAEIEALKKQVAAIAASTVKPITAAKTKE
jgi:hypothetical protein